MAQSLAVKYRPTTFDEVVGQDIIITILKRQLELKQFKHSYLFCGASGCGKTTLARIFAHEINEGWGSPIEIDAASNNGVDNVKSIIANASQRALDSIYKIYIIDECHQITSQGWNAFLKGIEEPPAYTIFIFCTTDPQKLPATIINRCMRFNFSKIKSNLIYDRLCQICEYENIVGYKESCEVISTSSNGQLRDAIANLEKILDYNPSLDLETTLMILGKYSYLKLIDLVNHLIDGEEDKVLLDIEDAGITITDWKYFIDNFINFIIDILKYILFNNIQLTSIPSSYKATIDQLINFPDNTKYYNYILDKLLELKTIVKSDNYPIYSIQIILLQIARCE